MHEIPTREEILRNFDLQHGLKCIPDCVKLAYRPFVEQLTDEQLRKFWTKRLSIVVNEVEPITRIPGHEFTELCSVLRTLTMAEIAAHMGQSDLHDFQELMFLEWAKHQGPLTAHKMFCISTYLTLPEQSISDINIDAGAIYVTAECLALFGWFRQAARVFESFLGLGEDAFLQQGMLKESLNRCVLNQMNPAIQAGVVAMMGYAIQNIAGRGGKQTVMLIESFLEITNVDYLNGDFFQEKRVALDKQGITVEFQATLLHVLCHGLRSVSRDKDSVALIENFLGLTSSDYSTVEELESSLRSEESFLQFSSNNQLILINNLAEGLRRTNRPQHAVMLLKVAFMIHDLFNPDSPANRPWSKGFIPPSTKLNILNELAVSFCNIGLNEEAIALLSPGIEADSGSLFQYMNEGGGPSFTAVNLVITWLQVVDPEHVSVQKICNDTVNAIREVRNDHFLDFGQIVDFLTSLTNLWVVIRTTSLARISRNLARGDFESAEFDERCLLRWGEEFENRLLLERMRTYVPSHDTTVASIPDWNCGDWSLNPPWDQESIRQRLKKQFPAKLEFESGNTDSKSFALTACCLKSEVFESEESDSHEHDDSLQEERVREISPNMNGVASSFHELIPENSVWFRGMFDDQGSLYWWACCREEKDIQILARGRSEPGAEERLKLANLKFDLGVERTWFGKSSCENISTDCINTLSYFGKHIRDHTIPELGRREILKSLNELHRVGRPLLASYGKSLFADVSNHEEEDVDSRIEIWQQEISSIQQGIDSRNRKENLNELSTAHLSALEAELDLSSLFNQVDDSLLWTDIDIMVTVPGPLLAMPLAFLEIEGVPLFERVASISTVCSLTLRESSAKLRAVNGKVSRQLLSAVWDDPDRRSNSFGLPYLQFQLLESKADWQVWSLGDNPRASRKNLISALNDIDKKFGVVVIGGHGNSNLAGIRLAPTTIHSSERSAVKTHWCGEGADFKDTDLIILVSCAVGRLNQHGDRDVEGLYAKLVGQGASTVVAARWPISDVEGAEFASEIYREYLRHLGDGDQLLEFGRARAFNQARKNVLGRSKRNVSFHQAAAFEIYGLG